MRQFRMYGVGRGAWGVDINKASTVRKRIERIERQLTGPLSVGIRKLPSLAVELDKATGSVYSA